MLDLQKSVISLIINDSALAVLMGTTVPNKNIFTGPVDIVMEKQSELRFPMIVIRVISESFRTVPKGATDSRLQLDIWSKTSELAVGQLYERVFQILNFKSADQGSTHIFWQRGEGLSEDFVTEMRLWNWHADLIAWSL